MLATNKFSIKPNSKLYVHDILTYFVLFPTYISFNAFNRVDLISYQCCGAEPFFIGSGSRWNISAPAPKTDFDTYRYLTFEKTKF